MKQTINRAELMAVITVVRQFGSHNRKIAVAMDSEYVYSGLQGVAARWRQNRWVTASGPVSNVDLWIQLLDPVEASCSILHWVKIPSHAGLRGNDDLANRGRLRSGPLYGGSTSLHQNWTNHQHTYTAQTVSA
mmetsp:Transcript_24458/g.38679  ORF Transcript_24458/g.38679 Transcript_24458/m.38679 type:complete len:133 (+) Transcript_24458:1225-1623(+)